MKKLMIILSAAALVFACNNEAKEEKKETPAAEVKPEPPKDNTQNPDYQKGLALVAQSDCLTCHKVDEKIIGPTYREVANKYGSMPDTIIGYLAKKVITGGSGNWGEALMIPHPQVSEEDAKTMVKYILLLKN
jgi:cytochrome c